MNIYATTLKCTFLEIKKAYFWMKIMILFFFCQKDNAIICENDHLIGACGKCRAVFLSYFGRILVNSPLFNHK